MKNEENFIQKYGKERFGSKSYKINWKEIKKKYDGIHFNVHFSRKAIDNFKTYPLKDVDAESYVFFNPVVERINHMKTYNPLEAIKKLYFRNSHDEMKKFYLNRAYSIVKKYLEKKGLEYGD